MQRHKTNHLHVPLKSNGQDKYGHNVTHEVTLRRDFFTNVSRTSVTSKDKTLFNCCLKYNTLWNVQIFKAQY